MVSQNLTIYVGRLKYTPALKGNDNGSYCRARIDVKLGENYNSIPVTFFNTNAEKLCSMAERGMTIVANCRSEVRSVKTEDGTDFDFVSMVCDQFTLCDQLASRPQKEAEETVE